MQAVERHYALFLSPGTFVSEQTQVPLENGWDIKEAIARSRRIEERHAAKPYGFQFVTQLEVPEVEANGQKFTVEPKEIRRSGTHYLTGTVRSAAEVLAGTDEKEAILRSNVECNGIRAIVENRNSYRFTGELKADDVVVDWDGNVIARGSDYPEPTKT